MISYLKGTAIQIQTPTNNRSILVLEVNQIGYELQVPQSMALAVAIDSDIQVFTHQQVREDAISLYGFSSAAERDLFRQLISVSGVGASLAIALLDKLGLADTVAAIVTSNIQRLSTAPGVGKKTAERLALELRSKLGQWRVDSGLSESLPLTSLNATMQAEVEMTLLALGYTNDEIRQALQAISQDSLMVKSQNIEDWLRLAIASIQ
ncbi:Holliday junction branch migration protein RuvA [Chamaesiphon minutus]|uniref:Holliday junction branch migration complex subunit RuvA n=1 Tax=Chamaesiphon minutus (strain ATCC 27169 / PCC 6605) TaxID=1173020 RepID=K9UH18_CHAP6|nr:Holliday junction branch migration protein RuvA [Chamaesiphon minutus]AFY93736.1 Holliday junction DNA helicase, RuvA subunit [Chamaesiphon minutus PCC 6605]